MIPCYVLVKDLVTWPRQLVLECPRLGLRPVIVDLGSDYPPTNRWIQNCPHEVLRPQRKIHSRDFWRHFSPRGFYIVTDPDLDLSSVPNDCVDKLMEGFEKFPSVTKVGLSLEVDDIPPTALFSAEIQRWERKFWRKKQDNYWLSNVGHTFALYHESRNPKDRSREEFFSAVRLDRPYTARHLPWYLTLKDVWGNLELLNYFYNTHSNTGPYWSRKIRDLVFR